MLAFVYLFFQFPALVGLTMLPSNPRTVVLTFFSSTQGKEARVFSIFDISAYFQLCLVFIWLVCYCGCLEYLEMLFGFECLFDARLNSGENWYFHPSELVSPR